MALTGTGAAIKVSGTTTVNVGTLTPTNTVFAGVVTAKSTSGGAAVDSVIANTGVTNKFEGGVEVSTLGSFTAADSSTINLGRKAGGTEPNVITESIGDFTLSGGGKLELAGAVTLADKTASTTTSTDGKGRFVVEGHASLLAGRVRVN